MAKTRADSAMPNQDQKIALVVQPGATPSSVMATLDIFRIAERFLPVGRALALDLLSADGGAVRLSAAVAVDTRPLPATLDGYAAVILPGFFAEDMAALSSQLQHAWQPVIARLRALSDTTLVAASCYGTFVLADAGRLDGRPATTTWWLEREFRNRYPQVRLDADQAMVDAGPALTAGAMTAHVDLSMQVLRRLLGQEVARQVASIMLVSEARDSQRPFMTVPTRFTDPLAQQAADWLAARMDQPFSAQALAAACHVSYRTLHRRFSAAAGQGPLEYAQALRVEEAKRRLENGRQSLDQIVAAVGYADEAAFRRLFTRFVGMSPAQYRRAFRRGD